MCWQKSATCAARSRWKRSAAGWSNRPCGWKRCWPWRPIRRVDCAVQHEHEILLADALAELPADYRDVIVLRHIESLPFEEVAQRMGRTAGAVRMLWLRALKRLRETLEQREVE